MFKKNKSPLIIVSLLVLALSLGAMAFTPSPVADPGSEGGRGRGGFNDNTYLADALGITEEELQAAFEEARSNADPNSDFNEALAAALGISVDALETARDAALAQALADGQITQEEYDQIQARQALKDYIDREATIAEALGITLTELQAAQDAGQHIPDLLDELGIDHEEFQANLRAAHEAALAQAVADGAITQEQADQISQDGFGGRGGPGSRGPGGPGKGGQGGQNGPQGPGGNNG